MISGSNGVSRTMGVFVAIVFLAGVGACSGADSKSGADSVGAIDTVKPLGTSAAESLSIDSSAMQSRPAAPPPTGELPPPGGETSRRGSTITPRYPVTQDPPPNLTGETRNPGGTMPRSRERDSATGPKLMIDEKGNVTPIKR